MDDINSQFNVPEYRIYSSDTSSKSPHEALNSLNFPVI